MAHACHGHMYQPSLVPLSRTGKKRGEGMRGDHLHWRVQGSTSSPTEVSSRKLHINSNKYIINHDSDYSFIYLIF